MRTINIGDLLRKPMRGAGLKEPPYIWRSYFASRAMLAESRGFSRDYRTFTMGHQGDIQHVYALHKKIPPDAVEAIRRGYRAALDFLETRKSADREAELKDLFRRQILLVAGMTEGEVDKMDLAGMSDADLQRIVRERIGGEAGSNGNGGQLRSAHRLEPCSPAQSYSD